MNKLTVALICGGVSSERDVSLAGGQEIAKALNRDRYRVVQYDPKTDLDRLVREARQIDTAFVNLHGLYGEDGTIQGMLDLLGVPYQCSGVLGSSLAMNKLAAKRIYEHAGLGVAPYRVLSFRDRGDLKLLETHARELGFPVVVKPVCGGSSVGMSIAGSLSELTGAVDKALAHDSSILLEAYVKGRELTGGVIGNAELEALPVVEIIPGAKYAFFDYEAKYTPGATSEICPAPIPESLSARAQDYACRAHRALFCKGYSRTDMIAKDGDLFVLETNTIPGMAPTSLLPLAARTAGLSFGELLDRLIDLSLEKR